uniref:Uncharacterized protein n=1 Tax=Glossina austeni TaxID=7395 RepID=A0A1A9UDI3_GLOAU
MPNEMFIGFNKIDGDVPIAISSDFASWFSASSECRIHGGSHDSRLEYRLYNLLLYILSYIFTNWFPFDIVFLANFGQELNFYDILKGVTLTVPLLLFDVKPNEQLYLNFRIYRERKWENRFHASFAQMCLLCDLYTNFKFFKQKHKTPNLLHLVHTDRKLSFYDISNAPPVEDNFRNKQC